MEDIPNTFGIAIGNKGEKNMVKDVLILTGAGQIGMAITRRIGFGKKIIIGDKNIENAKNISEMIGCMATVKHFGMTNTEQPVPNLPV